MRYFPPPVPPSIAGGVDGPVEKKVVVSKTLVLECEAAGHPAPSLTWLKDGSPVNVGENLRLLEQGRKMEIVDAVPSDSGLYVCVATSIAGETEIKYDVGVLGTHAFVHVRLNVPFRIKTNIRVRCYKLSLRNTANKHMNLE